MKKNFLKQGIKTSSVARGFTMTEILVTVFIMSILIFPVYRMFSGSIKVRKVSDNVYEATNFASSYMEALKSVELSDLIEIKRVEDKLAPDKYNISNFGISEISNKLKRYITIDRMKDEYGYKFYKLTVDIENIEKKRIVYSLSTLVRVEI